MSVTRPPSRAAAMPRHIDSSVTRISSRTSAGTSPTATVMAASPCQPRPSSSATIAPQSMEITSPSASTRPPGMPWTTSSLTEVQMVAGKPW